MFYSVKKNTYGRFGIFNAYGECCDVIGQNGYKLRRDAEAECAAKNFIHQKLFEMGHK